MPEQEFDRTLSRMMLEWCLHKDIRRIAQCLDPHMLGVFGLDFVGRPHREIIPFRPSD